MAKTYNTGGIAPLKATFVDSASAAYEPDAPGRVVFRLWLPGTSRRAAPDVTYTWLAAGGGDAAVVRESRGIFHVNYLVGAVGQHTYEYQMYSNTAVPANSVQRQRSWLRGR